MVIPSTLTDYMGGRRFVGKSGMGLHILEACPIPTRKVSKY